MSKSLLQGIMIKLQFTEDLQYKKLEVNGSKFIAPCLFWSKQIKLKDAFYTMNLEWQILNMFMSYIILHLRCAIFLTNFRNSIHHTFTYNLVLLWFEYTSHCLIFVIKENCSSYGIQILIYFFKFTVSRKMLIITGTFLN